jgi:flavodoxin
VGYCPAHEFSADKGGIVKGAVVFQSKWGNTRQVAEAIAKVLEESGHEINLTRIGDWDQDQSVDFLVLGSPTRMGKAYGPMKRLALKKMKEGWSGKRFATFSTGASMYGEKLSQQASEYMDELLKENGLVELAPPFLAGVKDMHGPLVEGELERAEEYGKELAAKLGTIQADPGI